MTSVALDRPLVLADALPLRDAVLVAGGAGLTIIGAQIAIHIPPSPVPVTIRTEFPGLASGATIWSGVLKKSDLRTGALVGEVGQGRLLSRQTASHW